MGDQIDTSRCPGCGASLPVANGPTHPYMTSTPACFAAFNQILACEYSDPALLPTHRLSVDTYAIQHPGNGEDRRQIQSVGLHLARLGQQLTKPMPPKETNDVMLGLGKHKHTLIHLPPPQRFTITAADVAEIAGTPEHILRVRAWAKATWADWSDHHDYILNWTARHL